MESALEVADRACSPFLKWRPEALFFRAELLERAGRTEDARAVYHRVLSEVCLREMGEGLGQDTSELHRNGTEHSLRSRGDCPLVYFVLFL